jgi:hypothetical protein
MITLQQLINVAPFPDETKKELLEASDTLSDSKKFELQGICWALISQWYENELRSRQEIATLEMAKGGTVLSSEDFTKISDDLYQEVVSKLVIEENEEDLEEVRQKLARLN